MPYRVELTPGAHAFEVAAGETVLTAARRAGVALPSSCEGGRCGTCAATLLRGTVHYAGSPAALAGIGPDRILCCQALPDSDLALDVPNLPARADLPVKIVPGRVAALERLAPDVMRLALSLAESANFRYLPGQYVDFLLGGGKRRSFSLATPAAPGAPLEFHIRLVPDGLFTPQVFSTLRERDLLRIQGPLGTFFHRQERARPILLVAGGTGFAPIQAMLLDLLARGTGGPVHLYWGARGRVDLYRHARVQQWQQDYPAFRYTPVLSQPAADLPWEGRRGYVHEALAADYPDLRDYDLYAAGPPPMVAALRLLARAHGLPEDGFFADAFEPGAARG